jgi:hypothetical protein
VSDLKPDRQRRDLHKSNLPATSRKIGPVLITLCRLDELLSLGTATPLSQAPTLSLPLSMSVWPQRRHSSRSHEWILRQACDHHLIYCCIFLFCSQRLAFALLCLWIPQTLDSNQILAWFMTIYIY